VWLPSGSRLETIFATRDSRIAELSSFVCEVAQSVGIGDSLPSAVRAAAVRHPAAVRAFDLAEQTDASIDTEFSLSEALTFPVEHLPAAITFERAGASIRFGLDSWSALDLQTLLSMCGAARFSAGEFRDALDEPIGVLFEELLERGILATGTPAPSTAFTPRGPGVTRLQHAGLLYRGRTAGVLVDPHLHSSYEPPGIHANLLRHQLDGFVDAILISHGHLDHFHLPTLMTFPREMPIVVPRAPRASMLCPDFSETLRALGFKRVITLHWYDPPVSIGDLQVHAFPFYGEQPLLREAPRHPDLRNHGNTYVVRHDSFTSWLLIDSGNDLAGRMSDVAHEVAARFGGIDLLLSNLREFTPYTPLYITGAGHYWLSLTPDQIKRFKQMRGDVITLGPEGVAEVCRIARARMFLPYAHWWGEPGEPAGLDERELLDRLARSLAAHGAGTTILPWRIGDTHHTDQPTAPSTMPNRSSALVRQHQQRLLEDMRRALPEVALSESIAMAFLDVPRHRFVHRYRSLGTKEWHTVDAGNLAEHLAALYADRPLCLSGDDDEDPASTISQPSVVLRMAQLLRLEPGHVVFELGSGSGWNAALMAHLVGSGGHVYSVEVIARLAEMAAQNVRALGLQQVTIVAAEGGDGYSPGARFDRAVFTAGSYDLPRHFYSQVRDGGLLLIVLKIQGGGDRLHLLRKHADHFESIQSEPCDFVPLRGRYHLPGLDSESIEALPGWDELERREVGRVAFRWPGAGGDSFRRRTEAIRSYLSIVEPAFRTFKHASSSQPSDGDPYFGLWDEPRASLVIAKDDLLVSYGTLDATERLRRRIDEWSALGMPSPASYRLAVYPIEHALVAGHHQWIVRRTESQFLWSLPAP
jgi:protein-L-isoaspartate(D-aspartate) O-methyltransferase